MKTFILEKWILSIKKSIVFTTCSLLEISNILEWWAKNLKNHKVLADWFKNQSGQIISKKVFSKTDKETDISELFKKMVITQKVYSKKTLFIKKLLITLMVKLLLINTNSEMAEQNFISMKMEKDRSKALTQKTEGSFFMTSKET